MGFTWVGDFMNYSKYTVITGFLLLMLGGLPVAGAINTISQGGMIFLGEEGLDLSDYVSKPCKIGYWSDPCQEEDSNVSIVSEGDIIASGTIGGFSNGQCVPPEDMQPDDIQKISDPGSFYVDPDVYIGKTGEWYFWDGTKRGNLAFKVAEPSITVRIWDGTTNKDVTNADLMVGHFGNFLIETNMASIISREGADPSDYPFNLIVKGPEPENSRYTTLISNNGEISLKRLAIDTGSWYWVSSNTDKKEPSATNGWNTGTSGTSGISEYKPGVYSVWVECNANSMKDLYRAPDDTEYTGKTVSAVKTVRLVDDDGIPLLEVPQPDTEVDTTGSVGSTIGSYDSTRKSGITTQNAETKKGSIVPITRQTDATVADVGIKSADAYYEELMQAFKRTDDNGAVVIAKDALFHYPEDYRFWSNMGAALNNLNRYEEAINAAEIAIKIDSAKPYAWYVKGYALEDQKKYAEALECYQKAEDYADIIRVNQIMHGGS